MEQMRRKDRQVTDWQEICAILDACQVLHLGLQGADGPYVVPLSFGWEEQAGRIVLYFHGASAGKKAALLEAQPLVCIECARFFQYIQVKGGVTVAYESVIGFGRAVLCQGAEAAHGLQLLLAHCGMDSALADGCAHMAATKVYAVALDEITAKRSAPAAAE